MRERVFRGAALTIGVLGIASGIIQMLWVLPGMPQLPFFVFESQVIVVAIFVAYGMGWEIGVPRSQSTEDSPHSDIDA